MSNCGGGHILHEEISVTGALDGVVDGVDDGVVTLELDSGVLRGDEREADWRSLRRK